MMMVLVVVLMTLINGVVTVGDVCVNYWNGQLSYKI